MPQGTEQYKVILKFNKKRPVGKSKGIPQDIESIPLNSYEEAEDTAEKGMKLYGANDYEIVPIPK